MTNAMGGTNLHTPQSIFQHMMSPQNGPQQANAWLQMPHLPPLSIPWSVPALQQPELIRFTGEPSYIATLHQKRKLDAPDLIETRQTKQFITEEKMAAHFKDLRISSNYQPQSPVASTSKADADTVSPKSVMDLDLEAKSSVDGEQQHPRLVLAEEIKSIPQEPIIPLSLLSKLERPTMALVLWEPPSKHLRLLSAPRETPTPIPGVSDDNNNSNDANNNNSSNSNSDTNDDNNNNNNNDININNNNTPNTMNNNNNEAMPDLNQALVNNSDTTVFEPMEL